MWLWEGTGARKAAAEGCRSCWEDSVFGDMFEVLIPQGAAILSHIGANPSAPSSSPPAA